MCSTLAATDEASHVEKDNSLIWSILQKSGILRHRSQNPPSAKNNATSSSLTELSGVSLAPNRASVKRAEIPGSRSASLRSSILDQANRNVWHDRRSWFENPPQSLSRSRAVLNNDRLRTLRNVTTSGFLEERIARFDHRHSLSLFSLPRGQLSSRQLPQRLPESSQRQTQSCDGSRSGSKKTRPSGNTGSACF